MYNYYDAVKADVIRYILEEVDPSEYADREELEERLSDELWTDDSVTGNASGSYTFNSYEAKEYVMDNIEDALDDIEEALTFGEDTEEEEE